MSDIGAVACLMGIIVMILRGWTSQRDELVLVLVAIAGGFFLALGGGYWLSGLGVGISTAIMAVFGLRARRPRGRARYVHGRGSLAITVLLWLEFGLAAVAATFWAVGADGFGLVFTGLALAAVALDLLVVGGALHGKLGRRP